MLLKCEQTEVDIIIICQLNSTEIKHGHQCPGYSWSTSSFAYVLGWGEGYLERSFQMSESVSVALYQNRWCLMKCQNKI